MAIYNLVLKVKCLQLTIIYGVADGRGLAGVWFAWHAEGPGVESGRGVTKIENFSPVLTPFHHLR